MNTPAERRSTRLLCTLSILLGIVTVTLATIASMRGHMDVAANFALLGVILAGFGTVVLAEANRAAKR